MMKFRPLLIFLAAGLLPSVAFSRRPPEPEMLLDGEPVYRILPRSAIPAVTEPEFVSAAEADHFLRPNEPVIGMTIGGQARAYSLWHLDHHEVVNDSAGGIEFAVTW